MASPLWRRRASISHVRKRAESDFLRQNSKRPQVVDESYTCRCARDTQLPPKHRIGCSIGCF